MRMVRVFVLLALLLAACGGSDDGSDTTAADDGSDTTAADDGSGDDGGETVDFGDIPEECRELFADFLRAIEPVVEDVDFESATLEDLEAISTDLEEATSTFDEDIAAEQCEEVDVDATDEEQFDRMIDFARDEAPGTVGYLTWIRDFAAGFDPGTGGDDGSGDGGTVTTGDCEEDIAALMEYIDDGATMNDLPLADLTAVGQLMTEIPSVCSPERTQEFFSDPAVTSFLEGS